MPGELMKDLLYARFARYARALSSGARLSLLEYAAQGECSVETLAARAELSVANASKHLQLLKQTGLVTARRDGLRVLYRLAGDDVVALVAALQTVARTRDAKIGQLIDDHLTRHDGIEPVTAAQLLDRIERGSVTIVDARPAEEYAAGHISGAVSFPMERFEKLLSTLPKRREVIAYCRGPYCLLSLQAVVLLRRRGWRARRLEIGLPEWRAAGLPVAYTLVDRRTE